MMAPVTVVSCVYGDRGYQSFVPRWMKAIDRLENTPEQVILATDRFTYEVSREVVSENLNCEHPQAYYLNDAIAQASSDWIWVCDIDDLAMPDALNGIEDVTEDVWQMGYLRHPDELLYIPPQLSAVEVLESDKNQFVAGSAFRRDAFEEIGGFPDVALQDWALWRRMARHGMRFRSSDRAHFHYNRHLATRGHTELTLARRDEHVAEMLESENRVTH
jgi:hypothetical protein